MADTPKIRFKGFTDEWEQRKLSELALITTGFPFDSEDFLEDGEYLVITNGNIQDDSAIVDGTFGNHIDIIDKSNLKSYILDCYDVLVTMDGTVGRTAKVVEGKQILAQRVGRLKAKCDPEFLYQWLNTGAFANSMHKLSHGGTIKHISLSEIGSFKSCIPTSIEEEGKIGQFFLNLDHLITLHQYKCDETKKLKKYMIQKMFPQNGKKIPDIRFAGFTDEWEQRKLGELALFNPKEELPQEFEYVDLESVAGTEMLSHRTETKATAPSRAQRLAHAGDLFYQTVRPYQKNNYLYEKHDKHYVFSTGYAQMRPFVDGYFLLSLVQCERFVKIVLDNCTGTSYPAINANDLAEIEAVIPVDKQECLQLGIFFRNLDHLITLHQRKCNELKEVKKFMLQNMFPQKG